MQRYQLFEFEDQVWFPAFLRNYVTDYLQFVANRFDIYRPIIPVLVKGLLESQGLRMVDLGSGGGGGLLRIVDHVQKALPKLKVVLTDFYPNTAAFRETVDQNPAAFSYHPEPVDACQVPPALAGLRTMFLSFHHFTPTGARQILSDAVAAGAPIAVFEAQKRDWPHLLRFAFTPLMTLLLTPAIRPLTPGRVFFTYLLPIVPLVVGWDGIVSVLRTYTAAELAALTRDIPGSETYAWQIGETSPQPFALTYLLGYPRRD